ncbi:hypothetical protein AOLI_G00195390 [Acnodon oligacanthus]
MARMNIRQRTELEMKEDLNANAAKRSAVSIDNKSSYEEIYANETVLDTQVTRSHKGTMTSGPNVSETLFYSLAAVCLGLLCVLLLAAVTVLCFTFITETNQLQTSYTNLTTEYEELQTSINNLIAERGQLQTTYNNLTKEHHVLLKSLSHLGSGEVKYPTVKQEKTIVS